VRAVVALALSLLAVPTGRRAVVSSREATMVFIPAGEFVMGATPDAVAGTIELCKREAGGFDPRWCNPVIFDDQEPEQNVLVGSFEIDRFEVSNRDYRACVRAGGCSAEPLARTDERFSAPEQPVIGVTFDEAAAYCRFYGKRLPTEAEWEKAARGPLGRRFPWGDDWDPRASNHGRIEPAAAGLRDAIADASDGVVFTARVGAFPRDRSPYGVFDLGGNVAEWVDDFYGREPPQARSRVAPRGPGSGLWRSVRGGSWRMPAHYAMAANRQFWPPDHAAPYLGFRCARTP
jgi:formylglycine-generating enzyme required for sulfatase activity